MFTNNSLGDIFLVSGNRKIIHLASKLSQACGIGSEENGHFGILPCADQQEKAMMLHYFADEFVELALCPHCFAAEGVSEKRGANMDREQAPETVKGSDGRD